MKNAILLIFFLSPIKYLNAQENKWEPVNLDEVLTLSLPIGFTQTDTIIKQQAMIVYSKIIESNTGNCTFYISIDSTNIPLNVHDRKSALVSLEGIGEGICIQYSQAGYRCERNDTAIEKIPIKKILIYENQNDLALFGFVFRANNKTYRIFSTVTNNSEHSLRPSDLSKLFSSIKFNLVNIKEYKFYSQSE